MSAAPFDRLHRFDAIDNVRDFGAYDTAAGRRIKPGALYRSGHHSRASDADLDRLAAFGLGAVVDLRRPSERRRDPSRRHAGFAARLIETDHDDGGEAPHMTFLKTADLTEASGRAFMAQTYAKMVADAPHQDLFRRHFQALDEVQGPVLIHCAAGKDRTGVLAMLTHRLLGVHPDDAMADYLLTNTAVDLEARAPEIARVLSERTGRTASHSAVVAFIGVEPAFMAAAMETIDRDFGGTDAYLEAVLGVDAARRDRIVERLSA